MNSTGTGPLRPVSDEYQGLNRCRFLNLYHQKIIMPDLTTTQEILFMEMTRLNPFEKKIVVISSLWWGPIPVAYLLRLLRASGTAFPQGGFLTVASLDQYIFKLIKKDLLTRDIQCNSSIRELVARKASAEADFHKLAEYMLENWPGNTHGQGFDIHCANSLRNIRLCALMKDQDSFHAQLYSLKRNCIYGKHYKMPLTSFFTDLFDPEWMKTLPVSIQTSMCRELFSHVIDFSISFDRAVIDYFLDLDLSGLPDREPDRIRCILAVTLLMSADSDRAMSVISDIQAPELSMMMTGWLNFLQGDDHKAVDNFDKALVLIRKLTGSKKFYFKDQTGLIYLLSLLRIKGPQSLKKLKTLLSQAKSRTNTGHNTFYIPAYDSLEAIVDYENMDLVNARKNIVEADSNHDVVTQFIAGLGQYWVSGKLSSPDKAKLQSIFTDSFAAGLDWLTMETGFLLHKVDPKAISSQKIDHIQKIRDRIGLTPLAELIKPIEPWRMTLKAIQKIVGPRTVNAVKRDPEIKKSRIIWLVDYRENHVLKLQPRLQTLNKAGQWSKGRNIALKTLVNESATMDFLTDEDRKILPAIKKYSDFYQSMWYENEFDRILLLLTGHPRLFLESSPDTSVEFVKGEPEVSVVKSGSNYVLSMTPVMNNKSVVLVRENPTRFRVVQAGEEHRRLYEVLSGKQFNVPGSGRQELLQTISCLSGLVTVHSDITGRENGLPEISADPMPCMRIYPAGSGFKADMTVRPFKSDGPFLKPGRGRANIIAEVEGKRTLAKRDLKMELKMAGQVESSCPFLEGLEHDDLIWTIPEPDECLVLLSELKEIQDNGLVNLLWPEGEKLSFVRTIDIDSLVMELSSGRNWFELEGQLQVDGETLIRIKELLAKLQDSQGRFVFLDEKRFIALTGKLRRRLKEIDHIAEQKGDRLRMPAHSILTLEELERESASFKGDKAWQKHKKNIQQAFSLKPNPPSTLRAELRIYQTEGYQWLSRMARLGLGACLADDMGLGKTIQALAVILERASKGPTLVVAPTSVCPNWVSETRRFAPTMKPVIYTGKDRQELLTNLGPFDLVICSYALLMQDAEELCSIQWQSAVLDEAQAIKNWSAKRTQAAMDIKAGFRMVTTGTPIENNLAELWTLFRFLNPGLLGSRKAFYEKFALPIQKFDDTEQKKIPKKIIHPFILRRLKSQVMEELPPRTEVTLKVRMGKEEAALYEAVRIQALENLEGDAVNPGARHLRVLTELTRLRQLCCHPRMLFPESNMQGSKLALVEEIISELLANGHKALVFSQFVKHLALVRERLDDLGIDYRYLDGSTPGHLRQKEIMAFQEGKGDLFLISLKAGGLGLNLTAADYVIHLDPWWNPAVEDQATDRSHRIGQENPVTVYRLVTENTVEEKIVSLHAQKRDLADSLLEGSDMGGRISAEELMKLLRDPA